jgi:hypothetical protein
MAKNELDLMMEHADEMDQVVKEHWKGSTPTEIAALLKKPRARVVALITEWQTLASKNEALRGRAREALANADAHYSKLISKAYEVIDEADLNSNLSAKTNAIKLISDMEAKRIDMLQKSGMLENKELAEEMMETQRKQEALEAILKDVVAGCPRCRMEVMQRLNDMSNDPVIVRQVHPDDV